MLEEAKHPLTLEEIEKASSRRLGAVVIENELGTMRRQGAAIVDDEGKWSSTLVEPSRPMIGGVPPQ
jgi:hypothetical protein